MASCTQRSQEGLLRAGDMGCKPKRNKIQFLEEMQEEHLCERDRARPRDMQQEPFGGQGHRAEAAKPAWPSFLSQCPSLD